MAKGKLCPGCTYLVCRCAANRRALTIATEALTKVATMSFGKWDRETATAALEAIKKEVQP